MEVLNLERTLTELDHVRLTHLLRRHKVDKSPLEQAQLSEDTLDCASVVPAHEVSPDVVTMYSQVLLRDLATDQRSKLTLCYPEHADPRADFVSILSPVGWSLLGLTVGAVVRWVSPRGEQGAAELLAILFQPESSGDYTM